MKRFLPFLSLAIIAAACNTSPELSQKEATGAYLTAPATQTDTAGMAEYQDWKAQNELAELEAEQERQRVALRLADLEAERAKERAEEERLELEAQEEQRRAERPSESHVSSLPPRARAIAKDCKGGEREPVHG